MAFWSSQTLAKKLDQLVSPPNLDLIDCNAVTLRVGREIFITPHLDEVYKQTKRLLDLDEPFQIPPGQFAFILTEESVAVPPGAMAFISMKATYKMQGLINVSGFHVDPGWKGPLIFSAFNAGPSPIHLQRGLPLFLIWYADLDEVSEKRKSGTGEATIPPKLIANLTNAMDSIYTLGNKLNEETKDRRKYNEELNARLNEVQKSQEGIKVTFASFLTISITLMAALLAFGGALLKDKLSQRGRPDGHQSSINSASTAVVSDPGNSFPPATSGLDSGRAPNSNDVEGSGFSSDSSSKPKAGGAPSPGH